MKPVLYRYRDTESVIKQMDGYTPGEGWTPLYSQDQVDKAVDAALQRAEEVCEEIARGVGGPAKRCAHAIRALKESRE